MTKTPKQPMTVTEVKQRIAEADCPTPKLEALVDHVFKAMKRADLIEDIHDRKQC